MRLRAAIERDLVWTLANSGAVSESIPHAHAALVAAEASGDLVLVAEALDHLCMAECLAGHDIDPDLLVRALQLDEQVGTTPRARAPCVARRPFLSR